jgi:hypothetical protein
LAPGVEREQNVHEAEGPHHGEEVAGRKGGKDESHQYAVGKITFDHNGIYQIAVFPQNLYFDVCLVLETGGLFHKPFLLL